ncbi:phytanoyl-CoA dioxygenase family protein [Aquicoccus porphyridii]|uniref:phytanoyl-CoA dioxygenase family protein n=1 Tax=Aquicoccus porphyridii TaxID=1852029 RepID=UPI00273DD859|nr:phytanoyl-CoA dioxygenase family protein [Aquicoccus porphyridii]
MLTEKEVEIYHDEGLVMSSYTLPEPLLDHLREAVDKLIVDHPNIRPESLSGPHNPWGQSAQLMGNVDFLEFCQHPDILDMVEQVIGPDIILWGSMLFAKPAGDGKAVPWHQDGRYWPIEPLETVTVRVSIDGSDKENGCMQYIPGSHKSRKLELHEIDIRDDMALGQRMAEVDDSNARDCILAPGGVSLHDVYTVHGSAHNRSTKRRADYAIRYMPATALYDRSDEHPATVYARKHSPNMNYQDRPIWLVRGEDRAGNDFQRGKKT